jgi:hypothetical protein
MSKEIKTKCTKKRVVMIDLTNGILGISHKLRLGGLIDSHTYVFAIKKILGYVLSSLPKNSYLVFAVHSFSFSKSDLRRHYETKFAYSTDADVMSRLFFEVFDEYAEYYEHDKENVEFIQTNFDGFDKSSDDRTLFQIGRKYSNNVIILSDDLYRDIQTHYYNKTYCCETSYHIYALTKNHYKKIVIGSRVIKHSKVLRSKHFCLKV